MPDSKEITSKELSEVLGECFVKNYLTRDEISALCKLHATPDCDFCNGTGLIHFNQKYIPDELQTMTCGCVSKNLTKEYLERKPCEQHGKEEAKKMARPIETATMPPFETPEGTNYSPARRGAPCPMCGSVVPRYKTEKFEGSTRIRFHRCPKCNFYFKSTEVDPTLDK